MGEKSMINNKGKCIKTNWKERAQTYNNIKWVNNDATINAMIKMAGNLDDKTLLDLGTGTGKVLKSFYSVYPKCKYVGLDMSLDMMKVIEDDLVVELHEGVVENLKMFQNNSFDIITARMVLHHSTDIDKAFQEAYRVLKPGGKFIVCEGTPPNRHCVEFYEEMFQYKEERHTFLSDDLTNYYINTGFQSIKVDVIVLEDMSLNNWVDNAGTPIENVEIIKKMHYEADEHIKQAYEMKILEDDIIMKWKFCVIQGEK